MYYYFYKITNKLNGKKYLGVHKTDNLDDGYMGSGVLLSKAKEKYDIENFTKEILKYFDNEDDMFSYEAEIVDENIVKDPTYYNIALGGKGGNTRVGKSDEEMAEFKRKQSEAKKGKRLSAETKQKMSNAHKGEKNAMYAIKSENHPRAKQIIINGTVYGSLRYAAETLGLTYKTFLYRYHKGYYS